jgi:hypothetical protein
MLVLLVVEMWSDIASAQAFPPLSRSSSPRDTRISISNTDCELMRRNENNDAMKVGNKAEYESGGDEVPLKARRQFGGKRWWLCHGDRLSLQGLQRNQLPCQFQCVQIALELHCAAEKPNRKTITLLDTVQDLIRNHLYILFHTRECSPTALIPHSHLPSTAKI